MKKALITGITGQDGSYLAEFLLKKDYEVYGLYRRSSNDPFVRIPPDIKQKIKFIPGCLRDRSAVQNAIQEVVPDEIYNLGAQSDVGISFKTEEETWETNFDAVRRLVRSAMDVNPKVRIYQASTSEMFGDTPPPQNENSPFNPVSPYAKAKTEAHEKYVVGYREKHGLFICSGILFNHESPRRGEHFVTRKITLSLAKIKLGLQEQLELGNLTAQRDWGFAGDYVEAMWMMLQKDKPEDFVIATGVSHTVEEFTKLAAHFLNMDISFTGIKKDRVGYDRNGKVLVKVNSSFYRPNEVNHLRGDATKARRKLDWQPKVNFRNLVVTMVNDDLDLVKRKYSPSF